jgi:hypothetical protein
VCSPPSTSRGGSTAELAFYTVADARYFLGAAALIASLRRVGHVEPVYVTDCGLEPSQRERLAAAATVVPIPGGVVPKLAKWKTPLAFPADVMVLVDADVLAVRPLTPLVELAASGKVVAFTDITPQRYDERWIEATGVPVPRRTYVNSGLVLLRAQDGVVERLDALQEKVFGPDAPVETRRPQPFKLEDQDVLNVVAGVWFPDRLVALDQRLAPHPPFGRLRRDGDNYRYREGGERPYVLHHLWAKPWLARLPPNHYSRLMARLLLAAAAPVPVDRSELPFQLRPGPAAAPLRLRLLVPSVLTRAWIKAKLTIRSRLTARVQ